MMRNSFEKIEDEVYARVVWGDHRETIIKWLTQEHHLTEAQAEELASRYIKTRDTEVRRLGFGHILAGTIIAGIAAPLLIKILPLLQDEKLEPYAFTFLLAATVYGLIRIGAGIFRMVIPFCYRKHKTEDQIPDTETALKSILTGLFNWRFWYY